MGQAIRTNNINVECDKEAFTGNYSIVSYWPDDGNWNLPYEKLSDISCLSVAGIRARFDGQKTPSERFFVLTRRGEDSNVLAGLRKNDSIRSKLEDLRNFDDELRSRIIASLAIKSLGMGGGPLLVCDNKNFLIHKSRKELVCLKFEVDEYLNLMAETTSFSHPRDETELKGRNGHVFSKKIGENWRKGPFQLVVTKDWRKGGLPFEKLYIQKKSFPDNKNTVAYWHYKPEDYTHGKLHYMDLVVDSVNEKFKDIIKLDFEQRDATLRDAIKTGKDTKALLYETLSGKSVYFEDPFRTEGSKTIIKQFKERSKEVGCKLEFPKRKSPDDMVIRICEPENTDTIGTHYSKSIDRMGRGVIQHITYSGNKKEDEITIESTRRNLVELFIKDRIDKKIMPSQLSRLLDGWTFFNYKIRKDAGIFVNGCSLKVDKDGKMEFEDFGLSQGNPGEDFKTFATEHLKYNNVDKICGRGDYKALEKDGNVYLIIDTKEIPILNFPRISGEGYKRVAEGEPLSHFKRKDRRDGYLEGYIEFHAWKSDGIDEKSEGGYSYISGTNAENVKIIRGAKMHKMPRVRKIFVLHAAHPERVDADIVEIKDMLKFGFGRWDEMMTYPFPFKFTQEYLDKACEIVFSEHWENFS